MVRGGYSDADRCVECGMKAILSETQARALAASSDSLLDAEPCRHGNGWHLHRQDRDDPLERLFRE